VMRVRAHLDNAITGARALQVIQQKPEWAPEKTTRWRTSKGSGAPGAGCADNGQRTHTRSATRSIFRRRERF